ncbi:MAG: sigma-54 dependent transcriptional regulator [Paracoccaceae bacterium]
MGDILVVDDEKDIRELVADILQDEGHSTRIAWGSDSVFAEINASPPALVILDIWLKGSKLDGIDILKLIHRDNPDIPVVIISGHGNVEIAVAAIKQGAYDFIEKPFNIDQLMVVISRALEASRLRLENSALREQGAKTVEMIGESSAFKVLRAQLEKVSQANSRVMLTGPAGAGKEIAAKFIHSFGTRSGGPFITVNSASIAPEMMEEVLFGRETAERGHEPGLFERAHGGVLFFDEVADMPYVTQSKILRVLVEQNFKRVGGQDIVRVDVRVISATNRNLLQEIKSGAFREELYHRINVVPISVPELEARREDIPELCTYFLNDFNSAQGLPIRKMSDEALTRLEVMSWPGNIRQLRNTIERVLILGPESGDIQVSELADIAEYNGGQKLSLGASFAGYSLREAREIFEREYLVSQIDRFGGNISKAAQFIGMERSALHRKLKSLSIATGRKRKLPQNGDNVL